MTVSDDQGGGVSSQRSAYHRCAVRGVWYCWLYIFPARMGAHTVQRGKRSSCAGVLHVVLTQQQRRSILTSCAYLPSTGGALRHHDVSQFTSRTCILPGHFLHAMRGHAMRHPTSSARPLVCRGAELGDVRVVGAEGGTASETVLRRIAARRAVVTTP